MGARVCESRRLFRMNKLARAISLASVAFMLLRDAICASIPAVASFPPVHPFPPLAHRAMAAGPGYFVDSRRGDDSNSGAEQTPWGTVNHALSQLKAEK